MEFFVFFLVAGMFFVPFVLAGWVLAPLDRMARQRQVRYQFALIDYLGLVLLIQIPMAVWHASVRSSEVPGQMNPAQQVWVIDLMLGVLATTIWWTGVRTFGQAGIRDSGTRAILVFLVLPTAYFGALAGTLLTIWAAAALYPRNPAYDLLLRFLPVGAVWTAIWLAGRYTHRLVRAQAQQEK